MTMGGVSRAVGKDRQPESFSTSEEVFYVKLEVCASTVLQHSLPRRCSLVQLIGPASSRKAGGLAGGSVCLPPSSG